MRTSLLIVVLFLAGCRVMTPPPMISRHRPTEPPAKGTTTVVLAIGFGGQTLSDDGFGVALIGSHQVTDALEAGLGVGFGKNVAKRDPDSNAPRLEWLLAARAFATIYPPDVDFTCATVGLGAGMASTGMRYWTVDAVASIGGSIGDVQPRLDAAVAYSSPWTVGGTFAGSNDLPQPVFHYGGTIGVAGHVDRHIVSGEFTLLLARRASTYLLTGAYGYGL